jgi:hypothetical protein
MPDFEVVWVQVAPVIRPLHPARAGSFSIYRKRVPSTCARTLAASLSSRNSSARRARTTRWASVSSSATHRRSARWSSRSRSTVILTRFGPGDGRLSPTASGAFPRRPVPAAAARSWARRSLAESGLTRRSGRPAARLEGPRTLRRCVRRRTTGRWTQGAGSRPAGPAYRSRRGPRASRGRCGCRAGPA